MTSELTGRAASLVFLAPRRAELFGLLARAFRHPWVASYQIGFGPPLIRSSDPLMRRLAQAKSALDKLEAYLDCCFLEDDERARLAALHRRLLVRRSGPLEAESLAEASADVFDLSLRLHAPLAAPPAARTSMDQAGVDPTWIEADLPPDTLTGRFYLHLFDPRGDRLLHHADVRQAAPDPETALALELRIAVPARPLYQAWAKVFAAETGYRVVDLGEPTSRAKVSRDGERA